MREKDQTYGEIERRSVIQKAFKQLASGLFFASLFMVSAFAANISDEQLDMAYREYSITAEEMDKFVTLDYDSFVADYKESGLPLETYVA